jgi:hypothetical protein
MGIEVVVFVLLSTNILVQNLGEDQYGKVRSGPPSLFQARSVRHALKPVLKSYLGAEQHVQRVGSTWRNTHGA